MADWLFSSGDGSQAHEFGPVDQVHFQGGQARAYLEELPVLPGIWLYRGEAGERSRFGIEVDGGPARQGRMILGTILSSRGVVSLEGCDDRTWRDDGRFYVLTPMERRVRYDIDAEQGWRTVALRLESEALDMLGADDTMPFLARQVLEGQRDDVSDMAPLPGVLRALSHALLRPPYAGTMQTLYRQAKVLELLAQQFSNLGDAGEGGKLGSLEAARVRMARDLLLANLRDPPDLGALSADVKLSAKRLNRGFRQIYGTTVFDYLRDARLDAARQALESGSAMPLKQMAWELGYGQVSNFVTAFRRRFGVPPGAYRSGGDGG